MFDGLLKLLKSRKFWSAIVGSIVVAVCDQLGVESQTVYSIVGLFGIQIAGQAVADSGVEAAKVSAKLAVDTAALDPASRVAALEAKALGDDLK
jgi:hypothetical protein